MSFAFKNAKPLENKKEKKPRSLSSAAVGENGGESVPPESRNEPEKPPSFDPDDVLRKFDAAYSGLETEIRNTGTKPRDIGEWKMAIAARNDVRRWAREYETADPRRKTELERGMRAVSAEFAKQIHKKAVVAARKLSEERAANKGAEVSQSKVAEEVQPASALAEDSAIVPQDRKVEIEQLNIVLEDMNQRLSDSTNLENKEDLSRQADTVRASIAKLTQQTRTHESPRQEGTLKAESITSPSESSPPKKKSTHTKEERSQRAKINRLKREIRALESRVAHPDPTVFREDLEPGILSREAKIRELELGIEKAEKAKEAPVKTKEKPFLLTPEMEVRSPESTPEPLLLTPEMEVKPETQSTTPNPDDASDPERARAIRERGLARAAAATSEGTRLEWKERLRGLILGAKERLGMSERGESLQTYQMERSKELDAEAGKYGPKAEKLIRSIGEKYNKIGWKSKLAVGVGLGVGAAAFSGVSAPLALLFGAGLGAQRAAGMAGMFLKFEKHLQDTAEGKSKNFFARQEWYKKLAEKPEQQRKLYAAIMSAGYTAGVSAAIGGAVHLASESSWGEAVKEWLKVALGHEPVPAYVTGTPAATIELPPYPTGEAGSYDLPKALTQPHHEAIMRGWNELHPDEPFPGDAAAAAAIDLHALQQETAQSAAAAAEGEAVVEIPNISVEATQGRGYEYMAKRLWEQLDQLKDKGLDPTKYAEGSDIRKLLEASPESIDKVVHQIAADPSHGFFNPDGTSVRIDVGSRMMIGPDGNLHLGEAVHAPMGAPVTPAYHPESASLPPLDAARETSTLPTPRDVTEGAIPSAPEPSPEVPPPGQNFVRDRYGGIVRTEGGSPVLSGTPTPEIIQPGMNQFGLMVSAEEPHIYADEGAKNLFAFGGSPAEREDMIKEYLTKNPESVVFSADDSGNHRVPWYLDEGKVTPGVPVRTSGFFGFFSTWMKPPGPEEFQKIIK